MPLIKIENGNDTCNSCDVRDIKQYIEIELYVESEEITLPFILCLNCARKISKLLEGGAR